MGQRPDIQYGKTERHTPDWLFILWMGGTALLSYSLVYALRKPFTAAEFEGLTVAGMDYKIVVSIIQLIGYVCAKLFGIKYISELQPQNRLKFIIGSAALSEASLLAFGLLPLPYNIVALFFNGLSLGCMWGVIFSFLEGRRTTDILASIMGVSMALSSGVAKSLGLYALNQLHVSEFWMPALVGGLAFPLLYGMDDDQVSSSYGSGYCSPFRSCHSQRTATLGALQTIYALTAFAFCRQSVAYCTT